jgi:osmoprotectant transport system permease protein
VSIVGVAGDLAILTGVPIGIAITQNKRAADIVLYVAAMIMTIPSIALFGVMIPILALIGRGIGYVPAVIAVLLYSQLPIIRNTYTAISQRRSGAARSGAGHGHASAAAPAAGRDADRGAGDHGGCARSPSSSTSASRRSRRTSVRAASARSSAAASRKPIRASSSPALAVSLLAIVADYFLLWVQRRLTPDGPSATPAVQRARPSGRHPMIKLENLTKAFETPSGTVLAADRIIMTSPTARSACCSGRPAAARRRRSR